MRGRVASARHALDEQAAARGLPRDGGADEAGAAEDHEPLRGVRGGHDEGREWRRGVTSSFLSDAASAPDVHRNRMTASWHKGPAVHSRTRAASANTERDGRRLPRPRGHRASPALLASANVARSPLRRRRRRRQGARDLDRVKRQRRGVFRSGGRVLRQRLRRAERVRLLRIRNLRRRAEAQGQAHGGRVQADQGAERGGGEGSVRAPLLQAPGVAAMRGGLQPEVRHEARDDVEDQRIPRALGRHHPRPGQPRGSHHLRPRSQDERRHNRAAHPHALCHPGRAAQEGGGGARVRVGRGGHHHQGGGDGAHRAVLAPGVHRRARAVKENARGEGERV
mmetsp:Transcript_8822/g.36097  ORF Transcript_8822/g.36097 Transcript_8822/m.36097 type:complete len:338 (+) Transcript_8822:732-1745(+)